MIRKTAENTAWLRSRQTVRDRDAEARAGEGAQEGVRAALAQAGERRRLPRSGAGASGPGVLGEYRYGLVDRTAMLVVALDEHARPALRDLRG